MVNYITVFNTKIDSSIFNRIKNMPVKEKGKYLPSFINHKPQTDVINIAEDCKYIDVDYSIKNQIWNDVTNYSIHNICYQNCIAYPPKGGMSWHTNGDEPGIRLYVSLSENGDSGMVWYHNNRIIVDKDHAGINIRQFTAPCWHGVWSNCYRFSIGFKIGNK